MRGLLIIILFIIFYGFYVLFTQILFGENNLIMIKGQLYNKPINSVEDILINDKTIKCAVLNFTLRGDKRLYSIKLNIDRVYQGFNALAGVNLSLENSGQLKVWIKKSDFNLIRPKVYSVEADDVNIYNQTDKPGNNAKLYSFIACLALLFVSIYYLLNNYAVISARLNYH
ncbi:hypothetical protein [Pedobacter frigiditerrae]|uniref:hypothetical protein n=1 Tax=Pedobacter frigiditerrae TaxID=2530452 RepID=UPI0029314636|nr:hypothetical protein [Pedobacter frigiditerrae]